HNHLVTQRSGLSSVADCIDQSTNRVKLRHIQVFFTRLSIAYNEEVSIINRVFPPSTTVASPFVEKVAQGVLYPFLTAVFDELHRINIESYLNAVSVTFVQCQILFDTLLPIQNAPNSFDEFLGS